MIATCATLVKIVGWKLAIWAVLFLAVPLDNALPVVVVAADGLQSGFIFQADTANNFAGNIGLIDKAVLREFRECRDT